MLNALSIRALKKAVLFFLPKDPFYDTQSNTKGVFFCDYLQHSVHITSQRNNIHTDNTGEQNDTKDKTQTDLIFPALRDLFFLCPPSLLSFAFAFALTFNH